MFSSFENKEIKQQNREKQLKYINNAKPLNPKIKLQVSSRTHRSNSKSLDSNSKSKKDE